jgi:hypothetical protein
MQLNATTVILAIIWEGLLDAQRLFPKVRSWLICPFGFAAL